VKQEYASLRMMKQEMVEKLRELQTIS